MEAGKKHLEQIKKAHNEMMEKALGTRPLKKTKNLPSTPPEKAKLISPYTGLGTLEEEGYDLRETIEQKYLFNQPGYFGMPSGFIPEGITSLLVAPGGCGKTYALMQCAVAAATRTSWFNQFQPTHRFKTLLIVAEEARSFAHNRMKHVVNSLGMIDNPNLLKQVCQSIHMLPLSGQMQRLTDAKGEKTDNFKFLKEYLEKNPEIKLVILDPASRFLGPQCELDNAAATDWVAAVNTLTHIPSKPTIIASHHANKSAIRPVNGAKNAVFDQSITRGASGLVDGVRLVLGMQRKEEDKKYSVLFKILKSNVCDIGNAVELLVDRKNGGVLIPKTPERQPVERPELAYERPKPIQMTSEEIERRAKNMVTNDGAEYDW